MLISSLIVNFIFFLCIINYVLEKYNFTRNTIFKNLISYHLTKIKNKLNDEKELPCEYCVGRNENISGQLIDKIISGLKEKGFDVTEYEQYNSSYLRII